MKTALLCDSMEVNKRVKTFADDRQTVRRFPKNVDDHQK